MVMTAAELFVPYRSGSALPSVGDSANLESNYQKLKGLVVRAVSSYQEFAASVQANPVLLAGACKDMLIAPDPAFAEIPETYAQLCADLTASAKKLPTLWRSQVHEEPRIYISHNRDETRIESEECSGKLDDLGPHLQYADTVLLVADFVMKKLSPAQTKSGYATIEDELEVERKRLQEMTRLWKH